LNIKSPFPQNQEHRATKKIGKKRQQGDPSKPRRNRKSLPVNLQMGTDPNSSLLDRTPEDTLLNMLKPQDPHGEIDSMNEGKSGKEPVKKPRKKRAPRDPNKPKIQRKRKQPPQTKIDQNSEMVGSDFFKKERKRVRVDSHSLPSIHELQLDSRWEGLHSMPIVPSKVAHVVEAKIASTFEQRVPSSVGMDHDVAQGLDEWISWSAICSQPSSSDNDRNQPPFIPEVEVFSEDIPTTPVLQSGSFVESVDLAQQDSNALTRSGTVEVPIPVAGLLPFM
jgi:hypothetical protein